MDIVARTPSTVSPDVGAFRDAREVDAWLRAAWAPGSADVAVYRRGPVRVFTPLGATIAVTLDDAVCAATAAVTVGAAITVTLDDATCSSAASVEIGSAIAVTLDDATCAAEATVVFPDLYASIAVTLEDATCEILVHAAQRPPWHIPEAARVAVLSPGGVGVTRRAVATVPATERVTAVGRGYSVPTLNRRAS